MRFCILTYMAARLAVSSSPTACLFSSPNSLLLKRSQFQTPICSGVNHTVAQLGSGSMEKRSTMSCSFFQLSPFFSAPRLQKVPLSCGLDLHRDADLGEIGLDDLGRGQPLGLVEDGQRRLSVLGAGLLQELLRLPTSWV